MADGTINVNLFSLMELCEDNPRALAEKLMVWGLIPTEGTYMCPHCGSALILNVSENRTDKLYWVCHGLKRRHAKLAKRHRYCNGRIALRTGTFFERSRLSLLQILGFVNLWVSNCSSTFISEQLSISKQSVINWSYFCREVVLENYIVHKQKLGGTGKTVEINESKFGKGKYHCGQSVEGQWVFGGYEQGTGRVFMVPVKDRSANTLLPVIRDWIEPGTTIISEFWKVYDCQSSQGYEDLKGKHSLNFMDPDMGAHTNANESLWSVAKCTMCSSRRRKSHAPGNLAQYMFQKRCTELKLDRTIEFLSLAGQLYNPLSPIESPQVEDIIDDSDCD